MTTDDGEPVAETALWALARDGDRDAFTVLYHRHADVVWRHGYRLTSSSTAAEDVLSATFLTAWRRRADVRVVAGSARPWLLTVAANEARTEWRRAARSRRLADRVGPGPDVDDPADGVVDSLDGRRRVRAVLDAVAALPTAQREVVALCLVAEVSQADASRALGVPEATLRSRLHRAREALRALLPEEVP